MNRIATTNSNHSSERTITSSRRHASSCERGQAMVELALTMPLLMLLLLGAAEFARMAYSAIETSNAARAGVQYGAQNHITASDYSGMQTAALSDGPNVRGLTATATHFCGCANGAPSTCAAGDCAGSRMLEYVQVNTSATMAPMVYYPGFPRIFTLNGQAIMEVWQ